MATRAERRLRHSADGAGSCRTRPPPTRCSWSRELDGRPAQFLVPTSTPRHHRHTARLPRPVAPPRPRRLRRSPSTAAPPGCPAGDRPSGRLGTTMRSNGSCRSRSRSVVAETVGAMDALFTMTVEYAKDRIAFGRPIGSFQALKHIMADDAMSLEACKAGRRQRRPRRAGRGRRRRRDRLRWSPPTSATWPISSPRTACRSTAASATRGSTTCTCSCAGSGRTPSLYGEPAWHRERVCALHGLGTGAAVSVSDVDTTISTHYRAEARDWLAANLERRTPESALRSAHDITADDVAAGRALQKHMYDAGYLGIAVPVEYGGQGLTDAHQRIWNEESSGYAVPAPGGIATGVTIGIIVPTLLQHASEEQKRAWIPKMLSGEEIWVQLLSEPGAGSDLAGLLTRATRDGDTWVLNGNKVWSSGALVADYGICLARTDWDAPKHRGLTWFKVPLDDPARHGPAGARDQRERGVLRGVPRRRRRRRRHGDRRRSTRAGRSPNTMLAVERGGGARSHGGSGDAGGAQARARPRPGRARRRPRAGGRPGRAPTDRPRAHQRLHAAPAQPAGDRARSRAGRQTRRSRR